jgi:hypothetical protein
MNIRNVVGAVLLTMGVLGWAYSQNPIFIIQIVGGIWLASYRKPPPTPEYTIPEDIEYQPEHHPDEKGNVCAHGVPMNQYCPICDGAQDDASEEHEEEPKVLGHLERKHTKMDGLLLLSIVLIGSLAWFMIPTVVPPATYLEIDGKQPLVYYQSGPPRPSESIEIMFSNKSPWVVHLTVYYSTNPSMPVKPSKEEFTMVPFATHYTEYVFTESCPSPYGICYAAKPVEHGQFYVIVEVTVVWTWRAIIHRTIPFSLGY